MIIISKLDFIILSILIIFTLFISIFFILALFKILNITQGQSMYPAIKENQIAICLPQKEYKINDIVVYYNKNLNVDEIFHRIIDKTDKGFVLKGDNNLHKDPGFHNITSIRCKVMYII